MKTRAITLTETILVILIIGTIMACLAPYLKGIQDFWIFTDRQTAILQGARDAMNKMIKTLKAAHSITDIDPRGRGTYLALTNYLDQPIVYFHNIESSPYYIGNTGNIKIGDLVMQTKDPSNNTVNSLLCQSIDSITFTYIKPSMDRSDPATSPSQVQAVRILFYAKDPDQTTDIKLPISCLAYLMNVRASRGGGTWAKTFGAGGNDYTYSVQQTTDGGYIMAGTTYSFGAGNGDVYLVKTNAFGNEEWSKTFGGSNFDCAYSVQQTTDGGYIMTGNTGSFGSVADVYLVKTNEFGNEEWSKTFSSGEHDYGFSVQQTTDGGYIVAGYTSPPDTGGTDAYLIKTNEFGNEEWSKTFDGGNADYAWFIQQTTDGGYIMAGETYSFGAGNGDVYLVKTNALGQEEWSKTFGGSDPDGAHCVQQTTDGGYIVAGATNSFGTACKFYLIKTNEFGSEEWSKTFDAGGYGDYAWFVQQTADDGYIMTGYTHPDNSMNTDIYLLKTNEFGSEDWSKTFGGGNTEYVNCVQQTTDGGYILSGYTDSFGAGGGDGYIIKTDSQGNCPEASNPEGP